MIHNFTIRDGLSDLLINSGFFFSTFKIDDAYPDSSLYFTEADSVASNVVITSKCPRVRFHY